MTPPTPRMLAKKRDGGALSNDEIRALIEGFVRGDVADYQMTALAMAVVLRGMTERETTALTLAMRDSGRVLKFPKAAHPLVDKHSTGGVGDKVSICLAPLVAACGVRVPMISGRGLGHTGGTLDKLEAIPGFRVDLGVDAFRRQVREIGCALVGQTDELAPADKRLYALRDVTATVESIPLITASILSKKLAEGIDGLVLDVKVGRGAFMKTPEDARTLARHLLRVGKRAGKKMSAVLTDMNAPLGRTVGNALETAEALEMLHGAGPDDLRDVTLALGSEMLRVAGVARRRGDAERRLRQALADGLALEVMRKVVAAQGGDPRVVDEPDRLPRAPAVVAVPSPKNGTVRDVDALEIGLASIDLGAGRSRADQGIDPRVGIVLAVEPGARITRGEPLAFVHAADRRAGRRVVDRVTGAFRLGRGAPVRRDPIIARMR